MTLQLLGTGASEGIPAFLCNCAVCRTARRRRGREIRQNSCALLTSSRGESLLVDLPPHIKMTVDLFAVDQERLAAILVTHAHNDHCLGLKYVPARAVSHDGYRDPHVVDLCLPSPVAAVAERLAGASPAAAEGDAPYRLRVTRAYEPFVTGPFSVTPLETGHARPGGPAGGECLGYLIEEGGRSLAYMLDSPPLPPQRTIDALVERRIDCLVFDCTFDGMPDPGRHCNIEGLIAMHRRLRPRVTIASHVSHRCLDHRALRRALRPHGIVAGYDGLVVRVR